ncbi:Ni/Fe hydrogenase subunit alpha [Geomonas sp. Red32]|uniref:Ni/Fe hydrogenase subunit alpha n=1 Tax=Geomonas sp. Red32 TaxID=2912856 RepID=UPI00254613AF|nr:Ni/Fe hydrogenase subunit alpha [Geomonas sp. Red32]
MASVVEINPLTRVEGHGRIEVVVEGGRVDRVNLSLTDSPRLFEQLLVGKSYREVPEIVCRICSICSTIHKLTAIMAIERAFGIEVSEITRLTRELIVQGGSLQDHALHLYCLVLPDLMGKRGVAELVAEAPDVLKKGLAIKEAGNLIQEVVGGRMIHPVNIVVGGLGQRIAKRDLLRLKQRLTAVLPACRETVCLFRIPFPFPPLPPPEFLALVPDHTGFTGGSFRLKGGESFAVENYREHVVETVGPRTHAKLALADGREPTVGALSRLNLGFPLEPGAAELFGPVRSELTGGDIRGNNLAQAVELCHAAERALALVERLLELEGRGEEKVEVRPAEGWGTAACEAPRGVLIHSYLFDGEGICREADVVTPTSLNQRALSRDLLALARGIEAGGEDAMRIALEQLTRCYDPCISCAVHLIRI